MLVIAKFYDRLLHIRRYFQIGLLVEVIMLFLVTLFLLKPYTYTTALLIYAGYQLTFMFGAYLVRAETLIVKKALFLSKVDIFRQAGYLSGMVGSYLFYKGIEFLGVIDKQRQVYDLHFILLLVEVVIILLFIKSFKGR